MSDSETLDAVAPCPSVIQPALRTEQLLPAGYLGPTSFIAGLEESFDLFTYGEQSNTDGRENSAIAPSPALVKRTVEVLRCLQHFPAIKNLVHKYYSVSQTAVIPSSFILNALDELEVTVNGSLFGSASDERLFTFSTFVTHNTSNALQIPQNSDGTVFHKYFTGPFLRLEIIGVICALAGRASYFGLVDSTVGDTESPTQFSRKISEILSTILTLGRQWERSVDIKGDFTWIALVYGFSCAGVLIRAMQEQARTGQPLLYSGSRSSLIRNLSVFISHLESMAGPEQATSPLFIRATSVFSSIIDGILDPRPEVPVNSTNPDTILNSDIETPFLFDLQGIDLFETQDFRVAFDDMLY
ncbi:hypothetical protein PENNAL_c0236G06588 [Penicillium nalgiovense]|uniref:Transcription factor domain-containing protein n=1 Tax=Penicillium nalgiovense TaxID=60175 RepID=A0A1V6WM30_PENNA|nr:hypothetical protein PENNAL_c0236G06588 [Penicillium nalgiovense]